MDSGASGVGDPVGHCIDDVAGGRYPVIIMANTIQRVAGLLAIVLAAISLAVLPALVASEGESLTNSSADSGDSGLAVTLESTRDQLPGGVVEFIATVENKTGHPQTNLMVTMVVSEHEEALQYVEDSTIGCCAEGGAEVALPPLGRHPTLLTPLLDEHLIWFKWRMNVNECALRDRWIDIVIAVRTDDIEDTSALTRVYIIPHTDLLVKGFNVEYELDTPTPSPGTPVRHTVRIVNDGRVVLDDLVVHLNPHDTIDQFLPTVSENASFYIVRKRGEEPGRSVALDPKWSKPTGRFQLDYLNPGNILVLSWTDYVATDAPIGTVVTPHVSVRAAGSQEWTTDATRFTVSLPRNDLDVDVQAIDPAHLGPSYFPGDLVTMRVTVSNRTAVVHDNLQVEIDLPFALSYVESSASYSTPIYLGVNARRVSDTWIDEGLSLPPIEPGHWSAITFKVKVGESVAPMNSAETRVTLRTADGRERHDAVSVDVIPRPDIEMTVRDLGSVLAGTEARVSIDIRNTGDVSLTDVRFGWEETCTGVSYLPGTLTVSTWVPTETGSAQKTLIRDDGFVLEQQTNNDDVSVPIGDLATDDGRSEINSVVVGLTVRIAHDAGPGAILALPLSVVARVTRNSDASIAPIARTVADGTWWKIEVVESLVTAEEFETAVRSVLDRIEGVARKTAENTESILALAETAREINDEIRNITTETGATTTKLEETTKAIEEQAGKIEGLAGKIDVTTQDTNTRAKETTDLVGEANKLVATAVQGAEEITNQAEVIDATAKKTNDLAKEILGEVEDVKPWDQNVWWIVEWMGFGALASLIAGIVFPFILVGAWKRWRYRQATSPDPPAPSTPSSWGRSIRWATNHCRAGATVLATALQRVRDWIDRPWRH